MAKINNFGIEIVDREVHEMENGMVTNLKEGYILKNGIQVAHVLIEKEKKLSVKLKILYPDTGLEREMYETASFFEEEFPVLTLESHKTFKGAQKLFFFLMDLHNLEKTLQKLSEERAKGALIYNLGEGIILKAYEKGKETETLESLKVFLQKKKHVFDETKYAFLENFDF